MFVCPGNRASLNCSVEPVGASLQWSILCECGTETSGSCRDTCTPVLATTIVNTDDEVPNGTLCGTSQAITYENSFTVIRNQKSNDTMVPFSLLNVAVPLEFQQQNATRLCLECTSQSPRYLQILGVWVIIIVSFPLPFSITIGSPSPPRNFAYHPDYTTASDTVIAVNFTWSSDISPLQLNDDNDDLCIIIITDASGSTTIANRTSTTSFTTALEFNTTYSVTLYTSRCNNVLMSDSFITSITIDKGTIQLVEISHSEITCHHIPCSKLISILF